MKKIIFLLFSVWLLTANLFSSQGKKAVVMAEKADIYAEPDRSSYLIETVTKGTVLTLFQSEKIKDEWYYITFRSKKKSFRISGFVQEVLIEFLGEKKKNLQPNQDLSIDGKKQPLSPPIFKDNAVFRDKKTNQSRLKTEKELIKTQFLSSLPMNTLQKIPRVETKFLFGDFFPFKITPFFQVTILPTPIFKRDVPFLRAAAYALARAFPNLKALAKKEVTYQKEVVTTLSLLDLSLDQSWSSFEEEKQAVFQKSIKIPVEVKIRKTPILSVLPSFPVEAFELVKKNEENKDEEACFQELVELPLELEEKELDELEAEAYFQARQFPKKRIMVQEKSIIQKETKPSLSSPKLIYRHSQPKYIEDKINTFPNTEEKKIQEKKTQLAGKKDPFAFPIKSKKIKFHRFTLGLGYGQSQGGMGIFVQLNTKAGISIHGGAGYYPSSFIYSSCDWVKNVMLFSGGLKYYLPLKTNPLSFYLDLQFGGLGVEAAQIFKEIWYYSFVYDYRQKTLWGTAVLGGLELRMGRLGFNGALGLAYNLSKLEWIEQNIFLTFDFGLLFYF